MDIIKSTFFFLWFGPVRIKPFVKTGARHESKTSQSVLKINFHMTKTRVVFKLSRCLFLTHSSFKTTCSCILSHSVTDIMRGREFEVKCRCHIGLMQFIEFDKCFPPLYLKPLYHTSGSRSDNVNYPAHNSGNVHKVWNPEICVSGTKVLVTLLQHKGKLSETFVFVFLHLKAG